MKRSLFISVRSSQGSLVRELARLISVHFAIIIGFMGFTVPLQAQPPLWGCVDLDGSGHAIVHPVSVTVSNPVYFYWDDTCQSITNYQLQILRLHNYSSSTLSAENDITANIDWGEALLITTSTPTKNLMLILTSGTGYYVWRVRRIYNNQFVHNVHETALDWGDWSYAGSFTQGATVHVTTSTPSAPYFFYYTQFDDDLNWSFRRDFAEGERFRRKPALRISEKMTYANFLQMPVQEQKKDQWWGEVLASHTVLDNLGRPSLTSLPAPTGGGEAFGYAYNFMLNNNTTNSLYQADDYDDQAHALLPKDVGSTTSNPLIQYYDQNPDITIPSSDSKPFSRTLYVNDGSNRPKMIASPGLAHSVTGGRAIRKFYSSTTATELIRIFGDEAPKSESVLRTKTIDPNGVSNVAYTDEKGKTLATCLSAPESPLLTSIGTDVFNVYDTISMRKPLPDLNGSKRLFATKMYEFGEPTNLAWIYDITPAMYSDACLQLCSTCDYKVTMVARKMDDDDPPVADYSYSFVIPPSSNCPASLVHHGNFYEVPPATVLLNPGNYQVSMYLEMATKNPVTNKPYIQEQLEQLETLIDANMSNTSLTCQVLPSGPSTTLGVIKSYINSGNIWDLLFSVLNVDSTKPYFYLQVGYCDTIKLPTSHCNKPKCTPAAFAEYMNDYLTSFDAKYNTSFYAPALGGNLSVTTTTANGFIITSNSELNQIITYMLAELDAGGDPYYTCQELWDAWTVTVQNYAAQQYALSNNQGTYNVSTTPIKVDWWFEFMKRAKFKIFLEAEPTSNLSSSTSNLRKYPYKTFAYTWGTNANLQTAFCTLSSNIGPTCVSCSTVATTAPCWYNNTTSNGLKAVANNFPTAPSSSNLFHMYNFYLSTKGINNPSVPIGSSVGAVNTSMTSAQGIAHAKHACYETCEGRADEAIAAVAQGLINNNIQASGFSYPAWQSAPSSYYALNNEYCVAYSAIEYCKQGCNISPVGGAIPQSQLPEFNNSMFGIMDIEVHTVNPDVPGDGPDPCSEDRIEIPMAPGDVVHYRSFLAWINRELKRKRQALVIGGSTLAQTFDPLSYAASFELAGAAYPCASSSSTTVNIYGAPDQKAWFSYSNPTNSTVNVNYGTTPNVTNISYTRTVSSVVLPNDLVKVEVAAKILSTGVSLPANKGLKFSEAIPTYSGGNVTVVTSMGVQSGSSYVYSFGGPLSVGQTIKFSYYIKIPNVTPGTATIQFSGNLYVMNTNVTPATVALTSSACTTQVNIDCPPLIYSRLPAGSSTVTQVTVCSSVCSIPNSCPPDDEIRICFKWKAFGDPPDDPTTVGTLTCEQQNAKNFKGAFYQQIHDMKEKHKARLNLAYKQNCLDPDKLNDFYANVFQLNMYQYTLYYYDRAGNLIRTVPPQGVVTTSVDRSANPGHDFVSEYDHNTLGQVLRQKTPDGGETGFWYDDLGKVRFSQNAKQLNSGSYSYTKYDFLGRVIETGEYAGSFTPALVNTPNFPNSNVTFVTQTVYSDPISSNPYLFLLFWGIQQDNLHNKVSYVVTDQDGDMTTQNDQVISVYSYDPHGNVKAVNQRISGMPWPDAIYYDYDPIKGKVVQLDHAGLNPQYDAYTQSYEYDADMRLKAIWVYAGMDDPLLIWNGLGGYKWSTFNPPTSMYKSQYWYHKHGLLRRHEMGYLKQGLDYTYTIQGWLKGINHSSGTTSDDPGLDGTGSSSTPEDVFGMVLNYYDGDFDKPGSPFNSSTSNSKYLPLISPLYNGNISSWQHFIHPTGTPGLIDEGQVGNQYQYDQLNRLVNSNYFNNSGSWNNSTGYNENFSYDKNGNIQTAQRNEDVSGSGSQIDDFTYTYLPHTNQLDIVTDASSTSYNMAGTAYKYDYIGNVTDDVAQSMSMQWTPQNKLLNTTAPNMNTDYLYYGDGTLARKHLDGNVFDPITGKWSKEEKIVFYIRDASGNLIAVYEQGITPAVSLAVKERYVYGTEMLAVMKGNNVPDEPGTPVVPDLEYMLKDHLGDVRVMLGEKNTTYPSTLDILSYYNNYAFGAPHPNRNFNLLDQRHAFNGQEKADEIKGVGLHNTFRAREYDPVYGRFWSKDPRSNDFPSQAPYAGIDNSPTWEMDPSGESGLVTIDRKNRTITISATMHIYGPAASPAIAVAIAGNVESKWNEALGKVSIGGESYAVQFSIAANYINSDAVLNKAISNTVAHASYKDNFIYISNVAQTSRTTGSSAYYSNTQLANGGGTTEAHEMGHGWGADHPKTASGIERTDFIGGGRPSIMMGRGSLVDAVYQIDPNAAPGSNLGVMNPALRCVTQNDIDALGLDKLSFNSEGKANLGTFNPVANGRADPPTKTNPPTDSNPSSGSPTWQRNTEGSYNIKQ